jgi:uncharacterized protein with beta-barrel porin domain
VRIISSPPRRGCAASPLAIVCVITLFWAWGSNSAWAQQCSAVGTNQTCVNSIFLSGGASGVSDSATLTITNADTGTVTGSTFGINATDSANVANFGIITGGVFGINATNAANVVNFGTISGVIGISASASNVTNNMGTISGTIFGISANVATVNNSGSISGGSTGIFATSATVANSGTIMAGAGGTGIGTTDTANVLNSGTISGGSFGISANNAAAVSNSGTISGIATGVSATSGNLANTGLIIGGNGISLGQNSTIVNAGVVIGSGGTAIDFGSGTNTLTLAPGSAITGKVIGSGADVFQLGGTGVGTFDVGLIGSVQQYEGFSAFNKVDRSTWTLNGTFTQSNPWDVQGGTLLVNGDLSAANNVRVDSGGTLGGTGTVSTTTINPGGTLAPGLPAGVGTLHVAGNLVLGSAASYFVQVTPGAASLTIVNGTASINGVLIANGIGGTYTVGQRYVVLSASGGVTGMFSNLQVQGSFGSTQPTIAYASNGAFLVLAPASLGSRLPAGSSINVERVAIAIDSANVGTPPLAFQNLFNLPPQQLENALSQLSGEAGTGAQASAFQITNEFLSLLVDSGIGHSGSGRAVVPVQPTSPTATALQSKLSLWGAIYGSASNTSGDPGGLGSHDLSVRTSGVAAGLDYHVTANTILGIALSGGGSSWSVSEALGGGRSDVFQAALYGSRQLGAAYLSGAITYGVHWISTNRIVTVDGFDQLNASYVAQSFSERFEGGYNFKLPSFELTPYVALQVQTLAMPAYSESAAQGISPFGLAFESRTSTRIRTEVGSWVDKAFELDREGELELWGRIGWARDWQSTPQAAATFLDLPAASFIVSGAEPPHNSLVLTSAAQWRWHSGWSFLAKLDGELAEGAVTYRGTARLSYSW